MNDNKLYVGNLPYSITSEQLEAMFSEFGEIVSAIVISDKFTRRSKGFGFVEFSETDANAAQAAIDAMHDKEVDGRKLVVNKARPKKEFND